MFVLVIIPMILVGTNCAMNGVSGSLPKRIVNLTDMTDASMKNLP